MNAALSGPVPTDSSLNSRIRTALGARTWLENRSGHGDRARSEPVRGLRLGVPGMWMLLLLASLTASADTTDDYFWEVIGGCGTISGTEKYLARYPQGKHAEAAYGCLDRMREELVTWEQVRSCRDRKNVEWYLERYPEGRYTDEAKACLATLARPATEPVQESEASEIERLLSLCEQHFEANRLTTGVGGTAVECYLQVLARDPSNLEAIDGLRRVFEKYRTWAQRALQKGDLAKARGHVDKVRGLVPEGPVIKELDEAIARSERQREADARIAAEEKAKRRADEAQFGQAESEGTVEAYEPYVRANPEGDHVQEARRRIEELKKRNALTEGERFQDCEGCPWMVVLPAGRVTVGSSRWGEVPPHEVVIGEPLAVAMFEVTVEEFRLFVEESGYETGGECWTDSARIGEQWRYPVFAPTGRHPVVCVNWEDAKAYVSWLSPETGERYRLLSESEWEYAARAGTTTETFWEAESQQCQHANAAEASTKRVMNVAVEVVFCDDGATDTAAVGSYTHNGFGLYDVLGNVREWVEDCWHENYHGAPRDGSAWIEGGNCDERVIRGGDWNSVSITLRSAARQRNDRTAGSMFTGFRVSRDLVP